jgi:hypothetical protein
MSTTKKLLATTDRVQKTHLEIRMTHHDTTVVLKTGRREGLGLSEDVGEYKVGV